jgi:lantibiotic biosynthesis protein
VKLPQYTTGERPVLIARVAMSPYAEAFAIQRAPDWRERARASLRGDELRRSALWCAARNVYDLAAAGDAEASLAVAKYMLRMAARTTPFGLFAAVATVDVDARTTLELDERSLRAHLEADALWAREFVHRPARSAARSTPVLVNELVIERGEHLLIFVPQGDDLHMPPPELMPALVRNTEAIAFIRRRFRRTTLAEIAAGLAEEFGIDPAEAAAFCDRLAETSLLLPAPPPVFVPNALSALASDPSLADDERALVADLAREIRAVEDVPVRALRTSELARVVDRFADAVSEPPKDVVKIDLTARLSGTLDRRVLADADVLAATYLRLVPPAVLTEYAERFTRRYEGRDRLVPLLELVSNDFGIGPTTRDYSYEHLDPARFMALVTRLSAEALRTGTRRVDLSEAELDAALPPLDTARLPESFEIAFEVEARDRAAIDRGDYLVVPGLMRTSLAGYQSAARFAHMLPGLNERAAPVLPTNPDGVDAELVYLPTPLRYANVAIRPWLYPYCIEIGCTTGRPRLALDRLFVGLDERGFFLWSDELGTRVRVHQTHRLNTNHADPVARLLAFIASDRRLHVQPLDPLLATCGTFVPRLVVGRTVLNRARWTLPRPPQRAGPADLDAMCATLERLGAPLERISVHSRGDHCLPCDLTTEAGRAIALDLIASGPPEAAVVFEEAPDPDAMWLETERGNVRTEFVLTYGRTAERASRTAPALRPGALGTRRRRTFPPGSAWQYVKIYCGNHFFDFLLCNHVRPLAAALAAGDVVTEQFFVRYMDHTGPHLRLRFKPVPASRAEFDRSLHEWIETIVATGLTTRIAFDTYEPEFERYGGEEAMTALESLFTESSEAALEVLPRSMYAPAERIMNGVTSFHRIGRLFSDGVYPWLDDANLPRKVPPSLRDNVGRIVTSLQAERDRKPRDKAAEAAQAIADLEREGRIAQPLREIMLALTHMHFNRMGIPVAEERAALAFQRAALVSLKARNGAR